MTEAINSKKRKMEDKQQEELKQRWKKRCSSMLEEKRAVVTCRLFERTKSFSTAKVIFS